MTAAGRKWRPEEFAALEAAGRAAGIARVAAGPLVRSSCRARQMLCENTGRALGDAPLEVKLRHLGNCHKADPAYAAGAAKSNELPRRKQRGIAQSWRFPTTRQAAGNPSLERLKIAWKAPR